MVKAVLAGLIFTLALGGSQLASAQTGVPLDRQPLRIKIAYDWVEEAWTETSTPYRDLRRDIEAMALAKVRQEIPGAEREAKRHPQDPMKQFRWALVLWRAQDGVADRSKIIGSLSPARLAMAAAASPRCSEYARVRFLYEAWLWNQEPSSLARVAERLFEKGYRDFPFQYWRILALGNVEKDPGRFSRIIADAQRLARQFPQEPTATLLVGTMHSLRFPLSEDPEDAYEALRWAERALAMLPSDSSHLRSTIEFVVEANRRRLRQHGLPPPPMA